MARDKLPSIRMVLERGGKASREFATYLEKIKQDTTSSPTFAGLTVTGLTASLPVVTNASKALASKTYASFLTSLSGQAAGAFSFNDKALTSVGTIGCDEITIADGHGINLQEDINFTGATGENQLKIPTNLADALSVLQGANKYMTFITSTGDEDILFSKPVDIHHTAVMADDHAFEIDVNAATYGDIKGVDIDYITGNIVKGKDEGIILVNIDETQATGGEVFGLEVLSTDGGADGIHGMKVGPVVKPIHQNSGTFINPTLATNNTPRTDVDNMGDGVLATTTTIFAAENAYIIISADTAIEDMELVFSTAATKSIKPTFHYSISGTDTFTAFTPVDGTDGCRHTGVVSWDADDLTNHVADSTTGKFAYKIIRTRKTMTAPVLGYAKTAATTEYVWDENGDVSIRGLTLAGNLDMEGNDIVDVDNIYVGGRPWFDVRHYGAVGDGDGAGGGTCDADAIDLAVAACIAAGGGVVYFPLGTYQLDKALTTITPSQSRITLRGAQWGASTIEVNFSSDTAIEFNAAYYSGVEELTLCATSGQTGVVMIHFLGACPFPFVRHCWFCDIDSTAILVGQDIAGKWATNFHFKDIIFSNVERCIDLISFVNGTIENVFAESAGGTDYFIYCVPGSNSYYDSLILNGIQSFSAFTDAIHIDLSSLTADSNHGGSHIGTFDNMIIEVADNYINATGHSGRVTISNYYGEEFNFVAVEDIMLVNCRFENDCTFDANCTRRFIHNCYDTSGDWGTEPLQWGKDPRFYMTGSAVNCYQHILAEADADAGIYLEKGSLGSITTKWVMYSPASSDDLRFYTSADKMVLDSSGNLQIDGDITVSGNDIKDSGPTTRITLGATNIITGHLKPSNNNAVDLGASSYNWRNLLCQSVYTSSLAGGGDRYVYVDNDGLLTAGAGYP